jgi:hypothetical protein
VNEGFASYSEYLFFQSLNQNQAQQRMLGVHNNIMSQGTGSVYVPISDQTNENRIFNSRLSYDKGGALVHMIRHWVNDDALFFEAMQSYQSNFANSTASAEDFIQEIETVTGVAMTNFLAHWYYGEGHPTYNGRFNQAPEGIVISLSQTTSQPGITPFFTSHIEIAIEFLDGTDTTIYVVNTVNNQQYFFPIDREIYTVSIDPDNWILNRGGVFEKDESLIFIGVSAITNFDNRVIEMYPNPSNGIVHFFIHQDLQLDMGIFDLSGRKLEDVNLTQGDNQIELNFAAGIYFVVLDYNGNRYVEQLLIK